MSIFNSPFLLGFDHFERTVDRISKLSSDSYPPYNIEQTSPNSIRITVAVAGFRKNELDVSLEGKFTILSFLSIFFLIIYFSYKNIFK